jgi:uncharacterized protein YyaL (SSP411 family)
MVTAGLGVALAVSSCSKDSGTADKPEEATTMTADHTGNRLAKEKSPYLLQHANNPVDWYPWGEEAFERARSEDKPIFLSIGYSTCHWCHVMEHESFEDSTVAALMNETFINIKVDRQERPDIDNVYMTICQMMNNSGGWPLTIVMTPDKKPFFAATYIPKENAYGRTGMLGLIPALQDAWVNRRDDINNASEQVTSQLQQYMSGTGSSEELTADQLKLAHNQLKQRFDAGNGGFGSAPKFPTPHNLLFLLRYWHRSGDDAVLDMVTTTLDKMGRGGIYDHIGFGFHRYSTDERWFAPHFEKMLYDQALIIMAYAEAYTATGNSEYRRIVQEVIEYVFRDMTDPHGAFYSAEDADSEGIEGKFYLWTVDDVQAALSADDAELFIDVYGLEPQGNFHEEVPAANIAHLRRTIADYAVEKNMQEAELRERLEKIRVTLFDNREKRIHPHKDDKILVDWNGLMIAALAKAAVLLDEPRYSEAAERAAGFVLGEMLDDGRLLHRYRAGEAGIAATVDDYAFMAWALIELYEATFNVEYLKKALELNESLVQFFWDETNGGLFFTASDGEPLIVRMKEGSDGAIPSGNSVAMLNLIRLGRITADPTLAERARAIGRSFHQNVSASPSAFTQMMAALDFGVGPSYEVVIVGAPGGEDTKAMQRALNDVYLPSKVVILKPADGKNSDISKIAEFTRAHTALEGKATAYVCKNYACDLPTTDIDQMLGSLGASKRR